MMVLAIVLGILGYLITGAILVREINRRMMFPFDPPLRRGENEWEALAHVMLWPGVVLRWFGAWIERPLLSGGRRLLGWICVEEKSDTGQH